MHDLLRLSIIAFVALHQEGIASFSQEITANIQALDETLEGSAEVVHPVSKRLCHNSILVQACCFLSVMNSIDGVVWGTCIHGSRAKCNMEVSCV
jgi:hypothetical protein